MKYQVSAGKSGNAAPVFFRRKETDPRVGMGQCGTGIALIISVAIISVKKISAQNKCAEAEAERGPSIRHYRLQIITGNGKIPESRYGILPAAGCRLTGDQEKKITDQPAGFAERMRRKDAGDTRSDGADDEAEAVAVDVTDTVSSDSVHDKSGTGQISGGTIAGKSAAGAGGAGDGQLRSGGLDRSGRRRNLYRFIRF